MAVTHFSSPLNKGFCCECTPSDFLLGATITRTGTACNILGSNGEGAHCLRMGPLWYSAFSPQSPSTDYSINIIYTRCEAASVGTPSCLIDIATLSPSVPGACTSFAALPGTNGDVTNATLSDNVLAAAGVAHPSSSPPAPPSSYSTTCGALASLDGDFAAFQSPPDFSSQLLLAPLQCDDFAVCGNRTIESSDRWLIIDNAGTLCMTHHDFFVEATSPSRRCVAFVFRMQTPRRVRDATWSVCHTVDLVVKEAVVMSTLAAAFIINPMTYTTQTLERNLLVIGLHGHGTLFRFLIDYCL